jgi:hypothetical protein
MDPDFGYSRLRKIPAEILPADADSPARVRVVPADALLLQTIFLKGRLDFKLDDNMVLREIDHPGLREFTFTGPLRKVRLFTTPIVNGGSDPRRSIIGYLNKDETMLVHLTDSDYIYIYEPSRL